MLINRSNLLSHLVLFKVIFPAHLTVSKAKRYPLLRVDTHKQFIILNHSFTFRSARQSSATGRGGGCKIVIGPDCRIFGTSGFCLSFLLEGMGIGCLRHLSYPQSRHLPPDTAGCATALWLGSGCGAGRDFTRLERDRQVMRPLSISLPSPSFPMPSVWGHRFMGRREEEAANLHHHLTPSKVFCSLPKPLKLRRPLHHSVHFLLSRLPRYCPFLVPDISAPANTCLSTQPLHCTWLWVSQWLCTWHKYFCTLSEVLEVLALPMLCQAELLLRSHGEQAGAVSSAPAPQHYHASPEKLTKALAMKAAAKKNLQSRQTGWAEVCEKRNRKAERRKMTAQHRGHR